MSQPILPWLLSLTLVLVPGVARACVVCNEEGTRIWPILVGFFGPIALGFICLLGYMFLHTKRHNVEQPARDMLESEFLYEVRSES